MKIHSSNANIVFYPIHKIKQNTLVLGVYKTKGFVVKAYTSPPCPPGVNCKPSMKNNIVISENNKLLDLYSLTMNELIIFVETPGHFQLGKKYMFSIRLLTTKSTSEPIHDVEWVSSEQVK